MNPKVSVVIPTYNVEKYICQCVDSILNQTYSEYEIIICDDCSTDRTMQYLSKYRRYPNIKIIRNAINLKQALTRNRCIEESAGEYILIQDADDISEPNRIAKLLQAFKKGIDFVGSSCYCFNEANGKFENLIKKQEYPCKRDLLKGIPFVHASILFKKECLRSVNGYRVTQYTRRGEDYDLIMRLYAAGFRGRNIPELLYGYRVDKEAILRRSFAARIDECRVRYEGYKANNILFPFGWIYIFKPVFAHFYQIVKYKKLFK